MELQLSKVCADLISIKDQFEDNADLIDVILENEKAEDLIIAVGMAIALNQGAITLNKVGESHLKWALAELERITESTAEGEL